MDKKQANAILDRIRSGESNLSLSITNEALEWSGDLSRSLGEPLRANGDEQSNDRPCALYDTPIGERVGWSRYLDCKTNQGIKK